MVEEEDQQTSSAIEVEVPKVEEASDEAAVEEEEKTTQSVEVGTNPEEELHNEPLNIDIELQMKEEVVQPVAVEIPEAEENKEEMENLLHDSPTTATVLDNESTAPSTQMGLVTSDEKSSNKYELFEHFLSFIETNEELNPVLCGYFAKLFQVIVSSHPKEIFTYIYSHPIVLDNLVRHSYQKSISDVLIRLMNT